MAAPSALDTLIELATRAADAAAQRLGAVQRAADDAQQKLALLTQYRDDYAARCQSSLDRGIGTTQLANFHAFMAKLETAIAGQHKVLDDARVRVAGARAAWQTCEQKKLSYATLAERAAHTTRRRDAVREQKQNDEFASRSRVGKPPPL